LPTRAFILVETQVGVMSADVVTGSFDVIALIEVESMGAMAELVTGQMQGIRGVLRTITCVAAG